MSIVTYWRGVELREDFKFTSVKMFLLLLLLLQLLHSFFHN